MTPKLCSYSDTLIKTGATIITCPICGRRVAVNRRYRVEYHIAGDKNVNSNN